MTRHLTAVATALAGLLAGASCLAQGMSSASYRIPSYVINSGGGTMASANYQLVASIGEPVTGTVTAAAPSTTSIDAGFLATLAAALGRAGDVNGDGIVDVADARLVLQVAGGMTSSSSITFQNGDVDAATPDGKIDVRDAARILRYLGGLQPTLP